MSRPRRGRGLVPRWRWKAAHGAVASKSCSGSHPAGRFPADLSRLIGGVLLLETSEELIPAREFGWILRSLGERGVLAAVDAAVVGRPPTSDFERRPTAEERHARRAEQRDIAIELMHRYNPDAVVVVGPPFGHTRPQWILPYGGVVTVDGVRQRLFADYS